MASDYIPGPWELDSAKDGDSRYQVIHGQLPKGIKGDFGYPVCDTLNRHHCISPDEDAANGRLIAAAPAMLEALEIISMRDPAGESCEPSVPTCSCIGCIARTAIRKALGRRA